MTVVIILCIPADSFNDDSVALGGGCGLHGGDGWEVSVKCRSCGKKVQTINFHERQNLIIGIGRCFNLGGDLILHNQINMPWSKLPSGLKNIAIPLHYMHGAVE